MNCFCPFGLLISDATFARNLLTDIPAEAVKPVFQIFFPNFQCNLVSRINTFLIFCNIQIGFIQGQRFYQICIFMKYLTDLLRDFLISGKSWSYKNQIGTFLLCCFAWHSRAYTILSGFITCRRNNSTMNTAYSNRFSFLIQDYHAVLRRHKMHPYLHE